jgi:hypothetical protein
MTRQRSSWAVGYALTAAVLMMVAGTFHVIAGLVGLFEDEFYVIGEKWVFTFDVTAWAWIHIVIGIVLFGSGVLVTSGNLFGRVVGIAIAGLSAVANFMWLPYYPVWSAVIIALDVAIIWALSLHGRDVTTSKPAEFDVTPGA